MRFGQSCKNVFQMNGDRDGNCTHFEIQPLYNPLFVVFALFAITFEK